MPPRLAPPLIAILVSGCMSFLVSGVATYRAIGLAQGFFGIWMGSWAVAWAIAFPTLFLTRPIITRWVMKLVRDSGTGEARPDRR